MSHRFAPDFYENLYKELFPNKEKVQADPFYRKDIDRELTDYEWSVISYRYLGAVESAIETVLEELDDPLEMAENCRAYDEAMDELDKEMGGH